MGSFVNGHYKNGNTYLVSKRQSYQYIKYIIVDSQFCTSKQDYAILVHSNYRWSLSQLL